VQQGKGSDIGAAFGSGASNTMFGSAGSTSFLMRVTVVLAVIFFCTSLALNYFGAHESHQAKHGILNLQPAGAQQMVTPKTTLPQKAAAKTTAVKTHHAATTKHADKK
jgi:preprotein translocase subunit SecG